MGYLLAEDSFLDLRIPAFSSHEAQVLNGKGINRHSAFICIRCIQVLEQENDQLQGDIEEFGDEDEQMEEQAEEGSEKESEEEPEEGSEEEPEEYEGDEESM